MLVTVDAFSAYDVIDLKRRVNMAIKIYIDQGHNPVNPNAGAEGNGYREQDLVYRIGVLLSEILNANGYETLLSRPSPTTQLGNSIASSLATRVNQANRWGADYFISLHTNASVNPMVSGSEGLVYSLSSPAYRLALSILEQLNLTTGLRNRGVNPRPGLYVLKKTQMPAVLVEMGFITNSEDASLMANSPQLFARGIADGIIDYVNDVSSVFNGLDEEDILEEDDVEDGNELVLPEAGENETGSGSDRFNDSVVYETYDDFITDNSRIGKLKIQAYRGEQSFPVEGVKVRVSRDIGDTEYIFFDGMTDANGIIDNIELPAPPRSNSLEYELPDKTASYYMTAEASPYITLRKLVDIYEQVKTIQPLEMILKTGR